MVEFFKTLKNGVIGAFFPTNLTCEVCGRDLFEDKKRICDECAETVKFIGERFCERCGRADEDKPSGCRNCKETKNVDLSRSVFVYSGGVEKLIRKFKYDGGKYLTDYFAELLQNEYIKNYFSADIITFVPMTGLSEFERGYNQSELLAESLSKRVGAPVLDLLTKKKETHHQAGLDYSERQKNLIGAFSLEKKSLVKGKKILVVDDVLTTGATADEIAKVLKNGGAKSVYLLTIASVKIKEEK